MIQGVTKTEAIYRAIMLDSSSSIKDFSQDRKKYYRKYIMSEDDIEDEDSKASLMGRIVETLLLEPELFDSRFYMSACSDVPSGLMLKFVEALYRYTKDSIDNTGITTKSFEEISKLAYIASGFKLPYDTIIKKFIGSDDEIYFREILSTRLNKLSTVTGQDVTNAENIVESLKVSPVTRGIVNLVSSDRWDVRNQFQVEGYSVGGHLFKSMMDKVIIDHQKKTIQIYDLKCVWAVEGFYKEYYLYRRAYIQGYLYYKAAIHAAKEEGFEGYTVLPPKFIVCDSINYYSPLIYEMSENDLKDAANGFEFKGTLYPGVNEIIEDLNWAMDNKIWNISRRNYLNNGVVNIKGLYENQENNN